MIIAKNESKTSTIVWLTVSEVTGNYKEMRNMEFGNIEMDS